MSSHAAPYRVNLSLSLPLMLPLAPPPPCVCLCSLVFCMFAPSTVPPRCVSTGPVVVRLAEMANERERG